MSSSQAEIIQKQYRDILARIQASAAAAGRDPSAIRLVAVTKTFPAAVIRSLLPLAPVCFGENRVQEAAGKMELLKDQTGVEWHLIGHLQTNKAARAAGHFDWIQSVDSAELLRLLERKCLQLGKTLPVLIEVNIGEEPAKAGVSASNLPALLELGSTLQNVLVSGLMAVPPWRENPAEVRPYFRRMRELRDEMAHRFAGRLPLRELSMGMSHDFEVAVEEGATMVRVGTAIFGQRV